MENKPKNSYSFCNWNIAEWDKLANSGNIMKSWSITKQVWNNETKKNERVGSITFNKKSDLLILFYCFEKGFEEVKEKTILDYGFRFTLEENKIKNAELKHFYKNKNGENKEQSISVNKLDLIYLAPLVNKFINDSIVIFNNKVVNNSSNEEINDDIVF